MKKIYKTLKNNTYIASAILALILEVIILYYSEIFIDFKYTSFRGDLFSQYYPFIYRFISGNSGYSPSLYLGSGASLTEAYYCMSPFNILFLINSIDHNMIVIMIIVSKISLCALTFDLFQVKVLSRRSWSNIIFSLCYAFTGFFVILHYHLMWLDAWYMLPVIMILVYRFNEKPKVIPLSLGYAYLFVTNFYMAFIVGVFSFIFVKKNSIKCLLRYFAAVAEAVLLSAFLLLPAFLQLIETNIGTDGKSFAKLQASMLDILDAFYIGNMPGLNNTTPFLYIGLLPIMLVPAYFMNKAFSLKERIAVASICLFLVASMFIKPLYIFWHAFDAPDYYAFRFSFLLLFMLIAVASRQWQYKENTAWYYYPIVSLVIYALYVYIHGFDWNQKELRFNTTFLVVYLLLLLITKLITRFKNVKIGSKVAKASLAVLMLWIVCCELIHNAKLVLDKEGVGINYNKYNQWYYSQKQAIEDIKADDSDFYRIRIDNDINYNSASLFNYNGVVSFCSSDMFYVRNALRNLGVMVENHIIADKGYTPITELLLGVKYNVNLRTIESVGDRKVTKDSYVPATVKQHDYYLPVGYIVSDDILGYKYSSNQFDNINNLITSMLGEDHELFEYVSNDLISVDAKGVDINYDNGINYMASDDEIRTVTYSIPRRPGYCAYMCVQDGNALDYINSPSIIGKQQGKYMGNLLAFCTIVEASYNAGTKLETWTLKFKANTEYHIDDFVICYYDKNKISEVYQALCDTVLENVEYYNGSFKGVVTGQGILFTSIPYEKSWNAYVDGKRVDIIPLLDKAFIGLKIDQGTHIVELNYEPRGKKIGIILTSIGLIILVVVFLHKKVFGRLENMTK